MILDALFIFIAHHINIRLSLGVDEVTGVTTCIIKGPRGIVGQQVLCYVLRGVRVDVKKKAISGFKEVVEDVSVIMQM